MAVKRTKRRLRPRRALTADVVGDNSPTPERVPDKWKTYHRRLIQLRDYLLGQRGELIKDAAEEQPAFSVHMADAGTDSFDRDLALSRISSEQDTVYEIDEALMRIRRGVYGVCEITGQPIERERLAAIPWTRFSATAEKQLEKDGTIRRTRLAPRAAMPRGTGAENEAEGSRDDEALQ